MGIPNIYSSLVMVRDECHYCKLRFLLESYIFLHFTGNIQYLVILRLTLKFRLCGPSKWIGKGSHDLLLNFGTLFISRERLELKTSNLACRFITSGTNERNAKLSQRGVSKELRNLLLNFRTPPYLGKGWS